MTPEQYLLNAIRNNQSEIDERNQQLSNLEETNKELKEEYRRLRWGDNPMVDITISASPYVSPIYAATKPYVEALEFAHKHLDKYEGGCGDDQMEHAEFYHTFWGANRRAGEWCALLIIPCDPLDELEGT